MINKIKTSIGKAKNMGIKKAIRHIFRKLKTNITKLPAVPPTVYIELTDKCNLKCVFCDRLGLERKGGIMSMELFKRIIDNASEIGVPAVKLNRFGESLFHPELIEMIKYAKQKRIPWVYFTTNGTMLTKMKSKELILSGLDSLTISFDGATKDTYEKIRIGAHYDKVVENIIEFIKIRNEMNMDKPRVVINTILSRDTEPEIMDVFKLWKPYANRINVIPVGRYGNMEDQSSVERTEQKIKRRPCHQIFDRLLILWDGLATVCCVDINGKLAVGDINESPIEELWKNQKFSQIRKKHLILDIDNYPICIKCDACNKTHYDQMLDRRKKVYEQAAKLGYKEK